MPAETYSLQRLLALRKLTRAISDLLLAQLKEHLAALAPALRPRNVLGDFVQGAGKEARRGLEQNFRELQALYHDAASSKPFNLNVELSPPIEVTASALDLVAVEYAHNLDAGGRSKTVTMTSPLEWIVTYAGFAPARLKELLGSKNPPANELQPFLLHFSVLHLVLSKQPLVLKLFEALRFSVTATRLPEFGQLPLTLISAPVTTLRPPDDVIADSTELSGKDAFQEVIDVDGIRSLRDPLKGKLVELARTYGEEAGS
jgi:hypothetical protein